MPLSAPTTRAMVCYWGDTSGMGRVLIKNGYVITIDPRRRECRALCLKSALRLERRDKEVQEKAEQRDHHR
jgi:hypothetical protein